MSDTVGGGDAPDDRKTVFGKPPGSTDDRETRYTKSPEVRSGPTLDDRGTHYDPARPEKSQSRQSAGDAATDSKRKQERAQALGPGARILNDQYELLEQVRGGAQARAFKARRIVDDHVVFVKIQENNTREHDVFAKQLSLRDRILAIRHRNLLRCYDIGLQGEALCEVYEFVDGQTLADWLDAWRESGKPIPEEGVRALLAQLADGINVLHETTGLMHRDIKPENIMVLGDGSNPIFQIVDYGAISRLDTNSVTEVIVTRRYGPPEGYERYTTNSNISRSWDWWSLGRLVQEAVDGVHAQDHIAHAFPKQVAQYASKESEQRAIQAIFDTIMSEREFSTYQIHAGMVELTQKNPRARPWIPLLRGLLTYSRRGRWGYSQIQRFLQGQEVAETYNARREVGHFELDGEFWALPQLAVRLAADAAQTTAEGAARWEKAKSLVYRGEIARHITSVLEDEDLRGRLKTCITRGEGSGPTELGNIPRDRELGTALALFTLAEGQLEVASVRDKILDAEYLVALAQRLDGDPDETGQIRLRELLSAEFQSAVRAVTPSGSERKTGQILEGIERIRRDIDELQRRLRKYDVEYARSAFEKSPEKAVVWVAASKEDDVRTIETEYRPRLFRTGNARLQEIYGAKTLTDRDPLDIKALRIALLNFKHNGFETYELQAQALQLDAQRWRAAAAMRSAAVLLWKPRVLWTFLWAAPLTAAVILYNGGIEPSRLDAQLQTFNWLYVGLAAVAVPLLLMGLAKLLWHTARHDLSRLGVAVGDKRVVTRKSLRQSAAQLIGQERAPLLANYSKRLRAINSKIRALSGVDHSKYVVPEPRLPLSWTACALFGLGALVLAFGGGLYGGVFHEGGTNTFRNNATRARELSPVVDMSLLLDSITSDDIPIRTTRVVIFDRGRNTECIVPEGETVYLKKAFGTPKPGGVPTAVVVFPKSLCPNQAEMHERREIARDALQSSVLNSPETAHKLALLDQKLDDHMRTRWPQYYVPPNKRRPHNQQPANVTRSANDCVVWANDGQELRFTGRIEREANGVTVAHMEGLDAHGDCTLTFADAWLLRERMDFWASHAKDANYARQFQRTQSEVTRAAGALQALLKGAPKPGARGSASPAAAQVEHLTPAEPAASIAPASYAPPQPTPSAAIPSAPVPPPAAQSPPATVSGNIDSFTPEGWPVVDGQTIRLAGIGDLAPAQLPHYENWIRSNGNNLDCSWTDRGAGYTCFTHNQARVNVGFMLLLNGTATASATAIPPYRKAMMDAMQARQGRWAQTGTARGQ